MSLIQPGAFQIEMCYVAVFEKDQILVAILAARLRKGKFSFRGDIANGWRGFVKRGGCLARVRVILNTPAFCAK